MHLLIPECVCPIPVFSVYLSEKLNHYVLDVQERGWRGAPV